MFDRQFAAFAAPSGHAAVFFKATADSRGAHDPRKSRHCLAFLAGAHRPDRRRANGAKREPRRTGDAMSAALPVVAGALNGARRSNRARVSRWIFRSKAEDFRIATIGQLSRVHLS
jgi:hypothetical protein